MRACEIFVMFSNSHAHFHPLLMLLLPKFLFKMILLYMQVFGEGTEAVKKSLEGIFDDTVPDGKVKINTCSFSKSTTNTSTFHSAMVSWDPKIK